MLYHPPFFRTDFYSMATIVIPSVKKKQAASIFLVFLVGLGFWVMPHSAEIPAPGWHLFSIFFATIVGIILKPLPIGALSLLALTAATLTKTLSLEEALAGFHSEIAWLVVLAFFISLGFIRTGLGKRIGYHFVAIFGKKTLGLGYGLLSSELILAPAIPSVTARTGGVIFPIAQSLAKSFGSDPLLGTERRMGSFLMMVCYQGSTITSAMFLTAMAANPLLVGLMQEAGYSLSWGTWAMAAAVPGILSLILMPLVVYKFYPPTIKNTPDAMTFAKDQLKEMGSLRKSEWIMTGIFIFLLVLWVFGSSIGIKATVAALLGISLLLVFKVLDWQDVICEEKAWDTFIWFSTLLTLANALSRLGFTPWFSEQVVHLVSPYHWTIAFGILFLIYYYSHYFFASSTAHVGAMFPAFLMVAIALGTPPFLAMMSLAFASNLFGGLTHYGSGPAPLYFGSRYVDVKNWWKVGFLLSILNILLWVGIGSVWWKVLGLW